MKVLFLFLFLFLLLAPSLQASEVHCSQELRQSLEDRTKYNLSVVEQKIDVKVASAIRGALHSDHCHYEVFFTYRNSDSPSDVFVGNEIFEADGIQPRSRVNLGLR